MNQADLSEIIGISERAIRGKHDAGIPHYKEGREVRYPLPDAVEWYYREKWGVVTEASMKARKVAAEARMKELELEQMRGELIHVEDLARLHQAPLANLRARLLALPGQIAAELPMEPIDAVQIIEPLVHQFMTELSETGGVEELEDAA